MTAVVTASLVSQRWWMERIVASGVPLLDWDDIEREVRERRGGIRNEEAV